ncbi:hypothetical protein [Phaeacidiphilus oryzae]|uniref:hypothetical protein n=1 Tax=Phaeacidiphilus oryzae TaxID=348818 RepID=UPI00055E0946|nr:hypothetical protein [Phaeacidiphilus oryzae]
MTRFPSRRPDRALAAAALTLSLAGALTACSGGDGGHGSQAGRAGAGHRLTLTVEGHGTAALNWSAAHGGSLAHAALPWHLTLPAGRSADAVDLSVVLDGSGGRATCSIAVDGRRVVSSLAQGRFGRANCRTPGLGSGAGTDSGSVSAADQANG